MSGPNHRYTHRWFQFGDMARQEKDDVRWTRTSGEEWDALMERAREALASSYAIAPLERSQVLRDILAYFGEQISSSPALICPGCGADRYRELCPRMVGDCPMVGHAQIIERAGRAARKP